MPTTDVVVAVLSADSSAKSDVNTMAHMPFLISWLVKTNLV
ncbi:hypothetical protein TERTU_1654 [Teredinibacter turnerae T7901]|uniref:Uncharacterized protein n=1 Tax=Teredinibacter turnerae (strain ATCC 39867 / T7901) TaxID=377629 RepID=C5BU03_TERTT|nr:hypothetical protein TERTU_1654 [Teredinibacter turnerae T7901]